MSKNALSAFAANENHPYYTALIKRETKLYERPEDIRSPFLRDYTRILHSNAYRRLKHKTQVFFDVENDHVCTRMEHVAHVESVSNTIASYLGLNIELTRAIAMGHDLGHAPFGHQGEINLRELTKQYLDDDFWHERNGIRFTDNIELLEDNRRHFCNLNLTFAVRDGIISHCGEVDENNLRPRNEAISLENFKQSGAYFPATWEGCVVKLSDKIAYLGRDIEDAVNLGFLCGNEMKELNRLARSFGEETINTTVIMHNMIMDVCKQSNENHGIAMSEKYLTLLNEIKRYNYKYIYYNPKLEPFRKYAKLVIEELFGALSEAYDGTHTLQNLEEKEKVYPKLMGDFLRWLACYTTLDLTSFAWGAPIIERYDNKKIYGNLSDKKTYLRAVIDYISGMTDRYAIRMFGELINYG